MNRCLLFITLLFGCMAHARGDVIIEISGGSIQPGMTAIADVIVRSNSSGGGGALVNLPKLSSFNLTFKIAASVGVLEFRNLGGQEDFLTEPSYVFNGVSGAIADGSNFFTAPQDLNSEISGSDYVPDSSNYPLPGTSALLARLYLQSNVNSQIGSTGSIDLTVAELFDENGELVTVSSVEQGNFTVTPEPGTIGLALAGLATVAPGVWRRRKRSANQPAGAPASPTL